MGTADNSIEPSVSGLSKISPKTEKYYEITCRCLRLKRVKSNMPRSNGQCAHVARPFRGLKIWELSMLDDLTGVIAPFTTPFNDNDLSLIHI